MEVYRKEYGSDEDIHELYLVMVLLLLVEGEMINVLLCNLFVNTNYKKHEHGGIITRDSVVLENLLPLWVVSYKLSKMDKVLKVVIVGDGHQLEKHAL